MNKQKIIKLFIIVFGLGAIFYLSFSYAFLTNFPIGHDAGHHAQAAMNIEKYGFFNFEYLKNLLYPIPLMFFALFHVTTGIDWPQLFLYTICSFLFLTSLAWTYFTTKSTDSLEVGIMSGIFLASSRWLSDALRIGFLGEVWGWFVFIICSYFLVKRKLWPLIILLIFLFFSHPLVFCVFILTFIVYSLLVLLPHPTKEDKNFFLKIYTFLILIFALILIFIPDKINSLVTIFGTGYLEGARSLKEIIIDSDKRRILFYLIGLCGIIKSIQLWQKKEIKYVFSLLLVSIILTQSYLFGMNFYIFRFYPYFEMAMSFFAAFGLYVLADLVLRKIKTNLFLRIVFLIPFVLILIWPNIEVNKNITLWQKSDNKIHAICPQQDRGAFIWVKENIPGDKIFIGQIKWGAWMRPISDRQLLEMDDIFSGLTTHKDALQFIKNYDVNYVYMSSIQAENELFDNNPTFFTSVYRKDDVRIYEVNRSNLDIIK